MKLQFVRSVFCAIAIATASTKGQGTVQGQSYTRSEESEVIARIDSLRDANRLGEALLYCNSKKVRFKKSMYFRMRHLDILLRLNETGAAFEEAKLMRQQGFDTPLARYASRNAMSTSQQSIVLTNFEQRSKIKKNGATEYFPCGENASVSDREWCWLLYVGIEMCDTPDKWLAHTYFSKAVTLRPENPLSSSLLGTYLIRENRKSEALPLMRIAYANSTGDLRASAGSDLRMLTKNREGRVP